MKHLLVGLLLAACTTPIEPDPTASGGHGSTTSAGASSEGGHGGATEDGGNGAGASDGGTGGVERPGLGYENGIRLRAISMQALDGARQFIGWRDTELSVDCAFADAEFGLYRCLPITTGQAGFYATPQCTIPLVVLAVSCPPIPAVTYARTPTGSCPPTVSVHRVGPSFGGTVYTFVSSVCTALPSAPPFVYTDLGEEPLQSFVSAERVTD